jgi:putative spermidine/putrescine transport system ATP-binding protein
VRLPKVRERLPVRSRAASEQAARVSQGASLSLTGVTKRYADQVAVDDVSLEIHAGEFVTLLGPSGSGKTTTLNLIAGFIELDEGEILLDGRPVSKLPAHKRNVGMVFQNYALFPHMTAVENIAFPLKQRRVPRAEVKARVDRALELVRLGQFATRYPKQLSGGQQQRVALARAIVFNPRALLMDEPLGALDRKLREALQLEIKRIHAEVGITFLYVTHDQEEALVMSDRIAIFNEGRIVQVGTALELYERPVDLFVADFVGESNLFRGVLVKQDSGIWLENGSVRFRLADVHGAQDEQVTVLVRPERVRLFPSEGSSPSDWNELAAAVEDVIYLGNTKKYSVRLNEGEQRLVARAQVSGEERSFDTGERVRVGWPPSDAVVLGRAERAVDS